MKPPALFLASPRLCGSSALALHVRGCPSVASAAIYGQRSVPTSPLFSAGTSEGPVTHSASRLLPALRRSGGRMAAAGPQERAEQTQSTGFSPASRIPLVATLPLVSHFSGFSVASL